ncbi:MAG: amidohydrolase [Bacteroidetes bacterium HGW-Bacteroidetes-22]|nr:MAG: amidohydrolase [Bacteroidetes bacterium HGW-Bacteroidetes-22]
MKTSGLNILFLINMISLALTSCDNMQKADLLVVNAVIYTADSSFSSATSMAILDGKIIYIGDEAAELYKADEILDADGKVILPGLIDAHCHFTGYGDGLIRWADLRKTSSWHEVTDRLVQFEKKNPSQWLLGRGWDQNDWNQKQFPDNTLLDSLFGDRPVAVTRIDGHAMIANSAALRLAGIDINTIVTGGQIGRRANKLTGLLLDNAMELVYKTIPDMSSRQHTAGLLLAQKNCFAAGLTALSDAGLTWQEIERIDSNQKAGSLKIRINAWLNPSEENIIHFVTKGPLVTPQLQVTAIKLYADGALGSRGALLTAPYTDDPHNCGIATADEAYFNKWADLAFKNNFQLCTHAIGDAANRLMLSVYARFLKGKNDRRWRIEHAQVVDHADMDKFGRYSIIPSMQPTHATSDMYWAHERLGDRVGDAYALKRLMQQNGWIPLGTDFPIEEINPMLTFYAALARKDLKGFPDGGFQPADALTRQEALWGMTLWAARANFTEEINGSLEPGKMADFVMLDRDIMTISEKNIPETTVLLTVINGKTVFRKH